MEHYRFRLYSIRNYGYIDREGEEGISEKLSECLGKFINPHVIGFHITVEKQYSEESADSETLGE